MSDTRDLYTFAADHAMLAYPLAVLVACGNYLQGRGGVGIDPDELAFLKEQCSDRSGTITPITNFLAGLV